MKRNIRINVSIDSALDEVLENYAGAVELSKSEAIYGVLKEAEPNLQKVACFIKEMKKAVAEGDNIKAVEAIGDLQAVLDELIGSINGTN